MKLFGAIVLIVVGLGALVSMRTAYMLTREPAPSIRVRWRDGTTTARRTWLQWKYRLVDPTAPQGLSYAYVLMDTRRSNIRALVKDPEVADTGDIDREQFDIPWATAQDSRRFMWVADRTPIVRQPLTRWTLFAALAGMVAAGVRGLIIGIRWRALARDVYRWLHRVETAFRDE